MSARFSSSPHFSPGGPCLINIYLNSTYLTSLVGGGYTHSVLFGFWSNLASLGNCSLRCLKAPTVGALPTYVHVGDLERSALKCSYGYAPAADSSTCFANLLQKSKSWWEMWANPGFHRGHKPPSLCLPYSRRVFYHRPGVQKSRPR